ncbi:hypothetical protein SLA2020_203910 [Shorea laevis]
MDKIRSNILWVEKSVPHCILMAIFKNTFLCSEEALQQSTGSSGAEVESSGVLDIVVGFITESPAVVAGGAAILVLPMVLSQVFGKSKPWGSESPRRAYASWGRIPVLSCLI